MFIRLSLSLSLLLSLNLHLFSQHAHPEPHQRVRVHLQGKNLLELGGVGIDLTHGLHDPGKHFVSDLSESELQRLRQSAFAYDVLIQDLNTHYRNVARGKVKTRKAGNCFPEGATPVPENFHLGSLGGFFTYDEMIQIVDSMRLLFPELISERQVLDDTLLTHEGRPIYWLRISDQPDINEDEPELLYTALHHAREPGSLSQMIFFMWYLLENYATDPDIQLLLDETELYFVPCLNPDGYIFNESIAPQGGGLWRKNRRIDAESPDGVDLNRNYGFAWGFDNFGSSPDPFDQDYRGPAPFSEPETRMVRNFCQKHEFLYALNYHTFGQLLIFPYGFNDILADPTLDQLADLLSSDNGFLAGGALETVGYPVNGVSDDWMYGDTITKNRIISITPELSTYFWTEPEQIIPDCQEVLSLNLHLARLPHNFYSAQAQLAPTVENSEGYFSFDLTRFGLIPGQATVSLSGKAGQFDAFGGEINYELDQYQVQADSLFFRVAEGTPSGTELEFHLTVNDGVGSRTDTLRSMLLLPESGITLLENQGSDLSQWEVAYGGWDTTQLDFFSPPSSITESPDGNYGGNTQALLFSPEVELPTGRLYLRFRAKWDIENSFDYVTVNAQPVGDTLYPLCGRFTNPGSEFQLPGEPLYDGFQPEWVHELIDLSDYAGQTIRIAFFFDSDFFANGDGFFFDDLQILQVDETVTHTSLLSPDQAELTLSPNPAREEVLVQWSADHSSVMEIELVNTQGRVVKRQKWQSGGQATSWKLKGLVPGQYFVRLLSEKGWVLAVEALTIY